jgi:hypothetical protein
MIDVVVVHVSDYYLTDAYFPFMPGVVFDALESAFLNGEAEARVPGPAFRDMVAAYEKAKSSN